MINFVLPSPYSFFVSLLILIGTYRLGGCFLSSTIVNSIFKNISNINFQKLIIGHTISLLVCFPLVGFTSHSNFILKIFAFFLIFLSSFEIYDFIKKYNKINFKIFFKDKYLLFNIIILFLFLLLTSSPETSADTLDYHIGTALNILRFDKYIFFPEWFTSIQSGIGEILIALGYSLGAEQYGSLIQFSSILSITGIIFKICENKKIFNSKYFANLIVISCPVLLFLASGSKPQFFFFFFVIFGVINCIFNKKQKSFIFFVFNYLYFHIFINSWKIFL